MPKKAMNYLNTIIYKIVCNDLQIKNCYVGHTTNFIKRKHNHKHDCSNETSTNFNHKIYQIIRENGGWDNWNMIEIEKYECNDMNEALARERYWYELLNADMNSCVPNRNKKEWYIDNEEKYKQKCEEYYENNKEYITSYRNVKYNCQCGGCYSYKNKSNHLKSNRHQLYVKKLV